MFLARRSCVEALRGAFPGRRCRASSRSLRGVVAPRPPGVFPTDAASRGAVGYSSPRLSDSWSRSRRQGRRRGGGRGFLHNCPSFLGAINVRGGFFTPEKSRLATGIPLFWGATEGQTVRKWVGSLLRILEISTTSDTRHVGNVEISNLTSVLPGVRYDFIKSRKFLCKIIENKSL